MASKKKTAEERILKYEAKEQEWLDLQDDLCRYTGEHAKAIVETYEKIYDEFHRVQVCYRDHFEIFTNNFKQKSWIPLRAGSLTEFIVPPDNTNDKNQFPDGFMLVKEQLKR